MQNSKRRTDRKMKTVKIILGVVITLFLMFISLGILIQELNYTSEITISKPVSEVFHLFNNEEHLSEWIPEIKSLKPTHQEKGVTGSTYTVIVENQGQEIVLEEKILAFEPDKNIKLFFKGGGMLKTDDYSFTEIREGVTVITLKSNCKSESFLLGCMLPLVKGKLVRQDQQYLNNFKKFAEKNL